MFPHPVLALALLAPFSSAFILNITSPFQCGNITASWSGGTPPYELLLVPVGHVEPEIRRIINYQNISTPSFSFPLTFPVDSQFVAVLSDATGVGSGGTTDILTVEPATDETCLGTDLVKPEFYFYLNPKTPTQCTPLEISWPEAVDAVSVWAIIPGGSTFAVPLPSIDDPKDDSLDCSDWTVDVEAGTKLLLVAGNGKKNGRGKGGSTDLLTVGNGSDSSCLQDEPSSSTTQTSSLNPTQTITPVGVGSAITSTTSPGTTNTPNTAFTRSSPPIFSGVILAVLLFFT